MARRPGLTIQEATDMILNGIGFDEAVNLGRNIGKQARVPIDIKRQGEQEFSGHNDFNDAMRHAETSRRLSEAIGPEAAWFLGGLLESVGATFGYPRDERIMDLHNNREGRTAFRERRPVDPRNLQVRPGPSPTPGRDYPYR